ncbi:MAG: hypothetical protein EVA65_16625 [Oceanococcus sp.]|nr:MAG: hypothetical protein EVA65_16625 [Oceanococcus sp.]
MIELIRAAFGAIKGTLVAALIAILVLSNVLAIVSSSFHDLLYGMFSSLPFPELLTDSPRQKQKELRDENEKLKAKNRTLQARRAANAKASRRVAQRVARRTAANLSYNVASIPGEVVPLYGTALILAVTAADVAAGCATVKDVQELARLSGAEDLSLDQNLVCGIEIPTIDQVRESFGDRYFGE